MRKCESAKVNMYKMRKWDDAKVCIKCKGWKCESNG